MGVDPGREFEVNFWRADISRANKILDWKPSVSLTDGVKKQLLGLRNIKIYMKSLSVKTLKEKALEARKALVTIASKVCHRT